MPLENQIQRDRKSLRHVVQQCRYDAMRTAPHTLTNDEIEMQLAGNLINCFAFIPFSISICRHQRQVE